MKNIKTLDVSAKQWFDKINGNSYFSVKVIIDYNLPSQEIFLIPFQYGYGDHYQYETLNKLKEKGFINDKYHSLWTACKEEKIILRTHKEENCKKRDLYGGLKSHNAKY